SPPSVPARLPSVRPPPPRSSPFPYTPLFRSQRAAVHVGADAALGAQVARHHLGGVERRLIDLAQVRVGLVGRVTVVPVVGALARSEEHASELQSRENLVCRLLPEKKNA